MIIRRSLKVCNFSRTYMTSFTMAHLVIALVWINLSMNFVESFHYSDLVALNVSCGHKDSCVSDKGSRLSSPLNWKERNCFCDNLCGQYGDCCINAATYNPLEQRRLHQLQECSVLRNYGGVYMLKSCPPSWEGVPQIEELCRAASPESGADRKDPIISLPVTSMISKITYANYYCALCNNDTVEVHSWLPRVECPTLDDLSKRPRLNQSNLLEELVYKEGSWGIQQEDKFNFCSVDPYIPITVVENIRLCKENINYCPSQFNGTEIRHLCDSYTALVYDGRRVYRNYHCATCHGLTGEDLSCFSHQQFSRFNFKDEFNPATFSVLLDFTDSTGGNVIGYKCNEFEIWDPFFKKCRSVVCENAKSIFKYGVCIDNSNASHIIEFPSKDVEDATKMDSNKVSYNVNSEINVNSTHKSQNIILLPDEVFMSTTIAPIISIVEKNKSFLNCNRILLPNNEYEAQEDGIIIISKYQKTLKPHQYELHEGGVLVCLFESSSEKFSNVMAWVSLAGLGVSFICLVLHLIAFAFIPDLQNLSGKNLACLCTSLLAAYSCFILGVFGDEGKTECIVLASLMYYFFLSSFCWMNVMAFDVWRTLRLATSELRVSAGEQWTKFILYSAYAWMLPAVGLTTMLTIDLLEPEGIPESYLPQIGQRLCWFGQRKALLIFFAAPLTAIMIMNIFCFVMAAKMIAVSAHSTAKFSSCQPQQNHFKLYMRLALLMGLSWISGILAGYLQEEILWYVFIVLNTLQGAFIFIAFTCRQKVFNALCCTGVISRQFSRPASSARRNLESRDSNNSQISHSSVAHLTPQADMSSTSVSL